MDGRHAQGKAGNDVPAPRVVATAASAPTASIIDARYQLPAVLPPGPPLLLTMVDAEEAFDWSRPFSRDAAAVGSMASQQLAHRVFEQHGVLPLYLVDYPVAAQPEGRVPLQELLANGACEIGAQMHPWVTPPYDELVCEANSYAGNLPPPLERAKAETLTRILEDSFGTRPRIYRTGRFGAGPQTAELLRQLGYLADSSVLPFWSSPNRARVPVRPHPSKPYWLDRDRTLLEIPVAAALVGRLAGPQASRLAPYLFHPVAERLGLPGLGARLGLAERIRLTPEGITIEEAKRLTRSMLAEGHRCFVLTYHSPSLEPGNTPYVRTLAQRERFLGWLDEFYAFFREEIGGQPASWQAVRQAALG